MWQNAQDAYLESRILSASPIELVKLLYQAAIESVRDARRHLANRDIAARARAISKASMVLAELTVSLDHERGRDVSRGLARLYDYMSRRLIEANLQQTDPPLEEVLGLLLTLVEGWEGIQSAAQPEPQAESPRAQPEPQVQSPWVQSASLPESPWAQSAPQAQSPWAQPELQAPLPDALRETCGSHAWSF
jgi:flagellar protein FliS